MKRFSPLGLSILLLLVLRAPPLWAWGDDGHRIVIEAAVRSLPEPVRSFYAGQLPFLLAHTSDPDDWSVIDPDEARRHYLDLELLYPEASKAKGAAAEPLAALPALYEEALTRFGPETLKQAGTVPWTIADFSRRLAQATSEGDWETAALVAAALGHYTSDAAMPLHTTVNYKGQLTGNLILDDRTEHRHVHVRFEVAMLHEFRADIKRRVLQRVEPVEPISNPFALARKLLEESHSHIDPVLQADRDLTARFGLDGAGPDRIRFTQDYYAALYERTGQVAVEQLARAGSATASLWLWAWQAAGSPVMPAERVAFGEQVVMVERGLGRPRRMETKVFRHAGSPYVLVTADWPKAGRFRAGRKLSEGQYQEFWRELEGAGVWELADAMHPVHPSGPTVTVRVARGGREHQFSVYAPEARTERRYGPVYRAVRALAPETPAPTRAP